MENMKNEAIYQICLSTSKKMLASGTINKSDYRKMKDFLRTKYQPVLPKLLGL